MSDISKNLKRFVFPLRNLSAVKPPRDILQAKKNLLSKSFFFVVAVNKEKAHLHIIILCNNAIQLLCGKMIIKIQYHKYWIFQKSYFQIHIRSMEIDIIY